ncbi:Tripartite ATP-independent periplasmic transporter, DctQ component [Psychromonas ingrahamii 37]|uniref:TRAP transporter small permease protein n=1 Tax=Psychromonas ingrahamii (strain DSM 17664 / CCUG 51855 / 37) TaxID=357804 RepID=A1SWD0_PSYIN|nr:TRAP transporter small permease [Psychromonas ingrahamii]ABM03795.1 Tripartite ATP-independent periplasmic transporter, DctQ component [Psychromonas ingrahamii 37]
MKNPLFIINRVTEKLEAFIIGAGIILMMLNSVINAMGRYLFNYSLYFSEELNQFLIVIVTFVGFAYAVRMGRNIRMTAVYDMLSFKKQKILTTFIAFSTATLMFYLSYEAYLYVLDIRDINRLSSALQIPVYLIYSIIPFGFFIAGLQYASSFIMNLLHPEIYLSFSVIETKDNQDMQL